MGRMKYHRINVGCTCILDELRQQAIKREAIYPTALYDHNNMIRIIMMTIAALLFMGGALIACDGAVVAGTTVATTINFDSFVQGLEIMAIGVVAIIIGGGIAWVGSRIE